MSGPSNAGSFGPPAAGRGPGGNLVARVLEAARAAGCREAELFLKSATARQVAWEPPLRAEGAAHVAVSHIAEAGVGLTVEDAAGRSGLAWRGGGASLLDAPDDAFAATLVREALAAASVGGPPVARPAVAPATPPVVSPTAPPGEAGSLGLVDALCLERPDAHLVLLAESVVAEVAASGEGAVEVDRVLVTEAGTSVRLVRLSGFDGAFDRTIAALSIALVPATPGAEAVSEERTACRLEDLDPASAARDAVLRALPPRPSTDGDAQRAAGASRAAGTGGEGATAAGLRPRIVLAPRAAATLLATLAPWIGAGGIASSRASALTVVDDGLVPGRPGSAPFDGAGCPGERRVLLDRGRPVGRIDAATGPFQRPSYRDRAVAGPSGLMIVPGRRRERPGAPAQPGPAAGTEGGPVVSAEVIEVRPGRTWAVLIRRGAWDSGDPADGLYWEGQPAVLVQAVAETRDDLCWYQVGQPIAAPSVVLEGLGPWRVAGADR